MCHDLLKLLLSPRWNRMVHRNEDIWKLIFPVYKRQKTQLKYQLKFIGFSKMLTYSKYPHFSLINGLRQVRKRVPRLCLIVAFACCTVTKSFLIPADLLEIRNETMKSIYKMLNLGTWNLSFEVLIRSTTLHKTETMLQKCLHFSGSSCN